MAIPSSTPAIRHPSSFAALVLHATIVNALVLGIRLVASYRTLALDADALALGIVASAFAILPVFAAVPLGRLTDRYGEPIFLALGAVLMGAGAFLTLAAPTIPLLALSQALLGIGQLMAVIGSQTLVGRWFPSAAARSGRFGLYAAGAAVGQLLGPIAGAIVVGAALSGDEVLLGVPLFVLPAIVSTGLALGILVREGRRAPRSGADGRPVAPVPAMTILRWPGMGRTMVASLAINLGVDTLVVFLGARVLTGRIVRKLGDGPALRLVIVIAAAAYLTIPLTANPFVLGIQVILLGLGLGLGQPLTLAWVAATSPPAAMGTAIAVRLTGNRVAQLFAPALLGALAGPAGLAAVFLSLGGLLGASAALLAWRPMPAGEQREKDR